MSFLWDLVQDNRIRQATADAREATVDGDRAHILLAATERKLARLSLVTEALWNLLKSRHGCTDEELVAEIKLLDLADGALDGRKQSGVHACDRSARQSGAHCMYCGAELNASSPFSGL